MAFTDSFQFEGWQMSDIIDEARIVITGNPEFTGTHGIEAYAEARKRLDRRIWCSGAIFTAAVTAITGALSYFFLHLFVAKGPALGGALFLAFLAGGISFLIFLVTTDDSTNTALPDDWQST
jgi:hypothetical protein